MPYSDNNPERRNLTVLSVAIIVYYLAGGKFLDGEVNLMLINATFSNPSMLIAFVWVMLCWFLFRYMVTNRRYYGDSLQQDRRNTNLNFQFVTEYIRQHHESIANMDLSKVNIYSDTNGSWFMDSPHRTRLIGFTGFRIKINYFFKTLLTHRGASDYYTPYLLFFWATGLGIYNYYGQQTC